MGDGAGPLVYRIGVDADDGQLYLWLVGAEDLREPVDPSKSDAAVNCARERLVARVLGHWLKERPPIAATTEPTPNSADRKTQAGFDIKVILLALLRYIWERFAQIVLIAFAGAVLLLGTLFFGFIGYKGLAFARENFFHLLFLSCWRFTPAPDLGGFDHLHGTRPHPGRALAARCIWPLRIYRVPVHPSDRCGSGIRRTDLRTLSVR